MITTAIIESPLGPLMLRATDGALTAIVFGNAVFGNAPDPATERSRADDAVLGAAASQLREYFEGSRTEFDLQLRPAGTSFQRTVWAALRTIPYGATCSYGLLARRVDRPMAARAIGRANGSNPIPIVIPCHRVIGADGSLTGYAGGVDIKRRLLEHESGAYRLAI
jgi:methylated-DNA-[protein]-cysteine S-methyltransferase